MKHVYFKFALFLGIVLIPFFAFPDPGELQTFKGCTLVPMKGADGDSFQVKFPDGSLKVVRLYAVDCIEAKIWDETDSRRLKEQRRYFGISHCRSTAVASIREAKRFGHLAYLETKALLSKPFTVHTSFADGRGSGYHKRVYAFVTTSTGLDLGTHLVARGLARAFGVCRENPQGFDRDELRAKLKDLEIKAAKLELGVWAETNWESFVNERNAHRAEEAELAIAIDRVFYTGMVDPNSAPRDQLMTLSGIGETIALRIIENRPFKSTDDLLSLKGIGEGTLEKNRARLPEQFHLSSK